MDALVGFFTSEQGLGLITLIVSLFVGGSKSKIFGGERFKTFKRIGGAVKRGIDKGAGA